MRHFAPPVLPIAIEGAEHRPAANDDVSAKLALIDISDQGIILVGLDGHLAWMNVEAIVGLSAELTESMELPDYDTVY